VERAQLHERVLMLDELKSTFVAIASHELRTPATSVYGVLATLAERDDLTPDTRERLIRTGYEQAERLRRLIEQLLDLSQLDARRITVDPEQVDLHTLLQDILTNAVHDPTHVHLQVADDVGVVADPLVVDRVISNLLVNAMRHGSPPIVVTAKLSESSVRVAVE